MFLDPATSHIMSDQCATLCLYYIVYGIRSTSHGQRPMAATGLSLELECMLIKFLRDGHKTKFDYSVRVPCSGRSSTNCYV
jgi:hypothetical protein